MNTCEHVYKLTGVDPCPLCGKPTHETNWRQVADARKKWHEEGKADWAVCKDCGGTIRGWWSI